MAQHTLDPTVGDGTVVVTSSGGKDFFKTDPAKVVSAVAGTVNALTAKATVVDADCVAIEDSAASYARKKTLFSTIVTYFLSVARTFAGAVTVVGDFQVNAGSVAKIKDTLAVGSTGQTTIDGTGTLHMGALALMRDTTVQAGYVLACAEALTLQTSAAGTSLTATATSDTPATTYTAQVASTDPAGYIKISVGGQARYLPFYT